MDTRTAMSVLGCGCMPGQAECLEAKRLKLERDRVGCLVQQGKASRAEWEAARDAYEQHRLNEWRAVV